MDEVTKLDMIIEKMNLSRLDTLVLTGILLPLSLMTVSVIVNSLLNRLPTPIYLYIAAQFMPMILYLPLLVYAHGYLSDNLGRRIQAIKASLYAGFFAIAVVSGVGYIYLAITVTSRYVAYQQLIWILWVVAFPVCFMGGWLVIFVVTTWIFRRISRWLSSQIKLRIRSEALDVNSLLKPLFQADFSPAIFKLGVVCASVAFAWLSLLWGAAVFLTSQPVGVEWAYSFFGFTAVVILTSLFAFRGRDLYSYFEKNGLLDLTNLKSNDTTTPKAAQNELERA